MRSWLLVAVLLSACGAADDAPAQPAQGDPGDVLGAGEGSAGSPATLDDPDGDGLCSTTERHVGTDPQTADTDGDGLPDLIESVYELDPLDGELPGAARLALLPAEPGATLDYEVRLTVRGSGQWHTGGFIADGTTYDDGLDAYEFYEGGFASAADPADNVRGIDREAETFSSVVGETRLSFMLHFQHPLETLDCVRAYPFRYIVRAAAGDVLAEERYLLVTVPPGASVSSGPWCTFDLCL